MCKKHLTVLLLVLGLGISTSSVVAQTTEFTYQGRLLESSQPANANYDLQFSLWDAAVGGTQQGTTQTRTGVAVANGQFAVRLDFGNQFPGSARFLQIAVRPTGGGAFTTLAPRETITNVPYSVKSISADIAAVADTATTATNSQNLGGVPASQYVLTTDPRMTDARTPTAGSSDYIRNGQSEQPSSNFLISGNGTAGGTLSGQFVSATFQYNLFGQPFLKAVSSNSFFGFETGSANLGLANTYAGYRAGNAATSNASNNSFFGANAGRSNSNGLNNSFFGTGSGELNSFGGFNAFFGNNAGAGNTIGNRNTFVGVTAGRDNQDASDNVFVGGAAGQQTTSGGNNSFFGATAGVVNSTGTFNSFFGRNSGGGTMIGSSNAFFGSQSGTGNVTGSNNTILGAFANVTVPGLTFAAAIGSGATVSANNTLVIGRPADTVVIPGTFSVAGSFNGSVITNLNASNISTGVINPALLGNGVVLNSTTQQPTSNFNISGNGTASVLNAATQFNLGGNRILSTPGTFNLFVGQNTGNVNTATFNSFFGASAGLSNTTGTPNSFFGALAGSLNSTGSNNAFFGYNSGGANTIGSGNAYFGTFAGQTNDTGGGNAFFGTSAGRLNSTGSQNSFYGSSSGDRNSTGGNNSFFGSNAGFFNSNGSFNSFFGDSAGSTNTTGQGNTALGFFAQPNAGTLQNSTAIGNRAFVGASNSLVLGSISGVNGCTAGNNCDSVNVGIGTISPQYRLDVVGRMRIKQNTTDSGPNNSAGLWLFQTTPNSDRAFVGMENDNSVGFFGQTGSVWGLVMNTTTGVTSLRSLGAAGSTGLCRNASNEISTCSSSARYKTSIETYRPGLEIIKRLRPVSFNWLANNQADFGLVAEEVAAVEPQLTVTNEKGEIEGVKYDRIGVVLVNAVNEQQKQIEEQREVIKKQQAEIDALKKFICSQNPQAAFCQ